MEKRSTLTFRASAVGRVQLVRAKFFSLCQETRGFIQKISKYDGSGPLDFIAGGRRPPILLSPRAWCDIINPNMVLLVNKPTLHQSFSQKYKLPRLRSQLYKSQYQYQIVFNLNKKSHQQFTESARDTFASSCSDLAVDSFGGLT